MKVITTKFVNLLLNNAFVRGCSIQMCYHCEPNRHWLINITVKEIRMTRQIIANMKMNELKIGISKNEWNFKWKNKNIDESQIIGIHDSDEWVTARSMLCQSYYLNSNPIS